MTFAELSRAAQVHRLRRLARRALDRYPIEVGRLRLQEHGYNTTFRVDATTGARYALRIDVNARKPHGALRAEMAWLAALATETDIVVPTPIATIDGEFFTSVSLDDLGIDLGIDLGTGLGVELSAAVMSWLPGRNLDTRPPEAVRELGRLAARLHEHAAGWTPPDDAEFPQLGSVLMGSPDRLRTGHPAISGELRSVFVEAFETIEPRFAMMIRAGQLMPIHADLHPWNVKWLRGRMSVFDFDDAGLSVPAHDLAIAAFYLVVDRPDELREVLFDGYRTVRPLPPFTADKFEAAIASRALIIANDVVEITNRDIRDRVPQYLRNTELRLRNYLDTGVYVRKVPGVVTAD